MYMSLFFRSYKFDVLNCWLPIVWLCMGASVSLDAVNLVGQFDQFPKKYNENCDLCSASSNVS